MIGNKQTLVAATPTKIATSPAGGNYNVLVTSALTDLVFGGSTVTSATGYAPGAAPANLNIPCGRDDLWAVTATGGVVQVLAAENG